MLGLLLKPWVASCHETRERLSEFLDGEVEARARKRILRHLARCDRCRALLESLTRTVEQLRSLGSEAVAPAPATVSAILERIERERR